MASGEIKLKYRSVRQWTDKLRGFEAGGSLEFLSKKGAYTHRYPWPKKEESALKREFQI